MRCIGTTYARASGQSLGARAASLSQRGTSGTLGGSVRAAAWDEGGTPPLHGMRQRELPSNSIITVVNLDPHQAQEGAVVIPPSSGWRRCSPSTI
jgi:hypothetical protein